ncbi:TetR/AcrR family transcriptional regulator [Haliea sp. E17]|uniref:TetR/AcrR family transcriptional regulator n=1 Tax=Haliea sp. E17 TaxID=3401576 RepID=UPI003AAF2C1F
MKANRQMAPDRLAHLIAVARLVFEEEGVGKATIDTIAQRAGISKATIYRQFDNKEVLFGEVVLHVSEDMSAELARFDLGFDDPAGVLLQAAKSIRSVHLSIREIVRLIIAEMPRHEEICAQARDALSRSMFERLQQYFAALLQRGQMDYADVDSATRLFTLIAMGGFRPLLGDTGMGRDDEERLFREVQVFLTGCGIRAPATG